MSEIDSAKLCQAFNQITDRIIEITTKPKPNYNIDGKLVSWGTYLNQLTVAQAELKRQIDKNSPPFEIEQQIRSW